MNTHCLMVLVIFTAVAARSSVSLPTTTEATTSPSSNATTSSNPNVTTSSSTSASTENATSLTESPLTTTATEPPATAGNETSANTTESTPTAGNQTSANTTESTPTAGNETSANTTESTPTAGNQTSANTTESTPTAESQTSSSTTESTTVITETASTTPILEFTTIPSSADTMDYRGDFESALSDEQMMYFMAYRSEASENRTLHLTDANLNAAFVARLCVQPVEGDGIMVQILNIEYSNDGPADNISLTVNDQLIGNAYSEEAWTNGLGWNTFNSTGPIGDAFILPTGNHSLFLRIITTDQWGVELDFMEFRALNQKQNVNLLCTAEFFEEI